MINFISTQQKHGSAARRVTTEEILLMKEGERLVPRDLAEIFEKLSHFIDKNAMLCTQFLP